MQTYTIYLISQFSLSSPYVGIHEHCTAAEILVFGRETSFPIQTLQEVVYVQVTPRNGNKLEYVL